MYIKRIVPLGIAGCIVLGGVSFALSENEIENSIVKQQSTIAAIKVEQDKIQDIKVTREEVKWEDEFMKINMRIPGIKGMKDIKYQEALNDKIMKHALEEKTDFQKQVKELVEEAKKQGWPVGQYQYQLLMDYSVKSKENILSFTVQNYQYLGGANGLPRTDYYNIDLTQYKAIQLADLFKETADYKTVINREIKRQMEEQEASGDKAYFKKDASLSEDYVFESISDTQSFYIEDENLVIGFAKYEIAPGFMGEPEFKIALKALKEMLKDDQIISVLNYDVVKQETEDKEDATQINYPQITNYPGELTKDYMNQSLKKIVGIYDDKNLYTDVKIDYEITKMDKEVLSILFKGTGKVAGKDINIQHSVNLDMKKSGNEITFDNLIKKDEASRKAVMDLLIEKAKERGLQGVEAEGFRIYFKSDRVVFYYMPLDDQARAFIELSVPKNVLEKYMNTDFGELPAS